MKILRLISIIAFLFLSATILLKAQTTYKRVKHTPQYLSDKEMGNLKAKIVEILQNDSKIVDNESKKWGKPKDVLALDDRIEFNIKNQKMIINFSDLFDYDLKIDEILISENNGPYSLIYYELDLWNCVIYFQKNFEAAKHFSNYLFFIQNQLRKDRFNSQLTQFKPIAEQYRALKEKPAVSEELRKFIVQANAFNQKKQFADAIYMYDKSIKSDPISYPAAYSNLALLSAQVQKFDAAIFYMKEYLLLEPEAPDARSAQDKIYEWEMMIK